MSPAEPRVFYFGYPLLSEGHFLHIEDHKFMPSHEIKELFNLPWNVYKLDQSFCPEDQTPGHGKFQHKDGWSILAIWDSSGDLRPGSHSTFLVDKTIHITTMYALIETKFPKIWKRMVSKYPVLSIDTPPEFVDP